MERSRALTNRYNPYCFNHAYDSYVRGVAFSPDSSYFVVTTTGGGVQGTLCDTAARFETAATGADIQPTWVDSTGGDTLWSVAVTEEAVYIGGHQRWMNNPLGSDFPGAGAVPRPGIAALDPRTGIPLKWNPGRNPRGAAAFVLYPTSTGLWVGSDTEWIGNYTHKRPRLAFFPLAGGQAVANDVAEELPANVYMGGATLSDALKTAHLDGTTATKATPADDGGIAWRQARGAFLLDGTLFTGWSDGNLYRRSFDGTSFGTATALTPWNDPVWAGVGTGSGATTYDGRASSFSGELPKVKGMFYLNGRLYYTLSGKSTGLYYRFFSPDSGIVGEDRFTATSGYDFSKAASMFYSNSKIYVIDSLTGSLSSIPFFDGVAGSTATYIDGPTTGGNDWRGNAVWIKSSAATPVPENGPIAFAGSDRLHGNAASGSLTIPASASAGDAALLFTSLGTSPASPTPPSGWAMVDSRTVQGMTYAVWSRTLTAADLGSTVTVDWGTTMKFALTVAVYTGVDSATLVPAVASNSDSGTSHTTPTVNSSASTWVLSYWSDKSAATTSWSLPAGVTSRSAVYGSGTGRVTAVLADSAAYVAAGSVGGLTAETDASSSRAVNATIVLKSQ